MSTLFQFEQYTERLSRLRLAARQSRDLNVINSTQAHGHSLRSERELRRDIMRRALLCLFRIGTPSLVLLDSSGAKSGCQGPG